MSHSPALESSPAATTPSTPVLRNLVANERNPSRSPPHSRDDRFQYQPEKVKEFQDRDNNMKRDSHNASERERNRDHHGASDRDSKRESVNSDSRREYSAAAPERDGPKRDSSHYNLERESKRDSHGDPNPKRDSHGESKRESHSAQDRERMREHQNLNLDREKYTLLGEFGKEDSRPSSVKGNQRLSTGLQVSMAAANAVASFSSTPLHGNFSTDHQWYGVTQQTPPGAAPHSPGAVSWGGEAPGATSSDKSSETGAPRLSRKESYKAQRQHYRKEKKRAASALLSSLEDPAVVILADWLKVRGSLKSWTKLWCVLKPGLLLLYKSSKAKSNHWVGTVLLSACQVIERPSKKDGFCFKLYHPLEQSIWAPRGPHNETIGAVVQPLPTAHLIFRAPSQAAGKCWLDGLELALKSSNMLLRSDQRCGASGIKVTDATTNHETQWSPEDLERHFHEHDLDGADITESDSEGGGQQPLDETELDGSVRPLIMPSGQRDPSGGLSSKVILDRVVARLNAVYDDELNDDVGQSGEVMEELGEENKSLLWFLVKQVRPGMDLSKVVLPTFILEPRSFLDKLSDSFYHSDILASAWRHQDPFDRMKTVVTWYLSGLYRKPRGLKKPYNPVLGETFRCCWQHPQSDTRTYYVSEQVSHHPPISAFYVSNRKEGFAIEASILAKSKFYGNSTSAILDGIARVTLLPLGETYLATSPYAHCKGLLVGTLTMELGGRVTIACPHTGHTAEIEFKLKPFIGGSDSINMVSGRIRHNKDTLATIEGHWDGRIDIKDRRTQEESVLLDVAELKGRRLRRQLIAPNHLGDFESQRLWQKVSMAIANEDQIAATEEKTIIEEAQRERARGNSGKEWEPRYFRKGSPSGQDLQDDHDQSHQNHWQYINPDLRPWDESADILEYESDFVIRTLRRQPGSNLLLMPPVGIISETGVIQAVQGIQLLETERSASETDSTNSHHRRTPVAQGQQSVTAALLRMESALREQATELAGVRAVVERLDTPHRQQYRSNAAGHGSSLQHPTQLAWPRTSSTILNALVVLFVAYVLQTFGNWLLGR